MKLSIYREELLKPLQLVSGIVEKRLTLPILSNVLLKVTDVLTLTATDLEVELILPIPLSQPATNSEGSSSSTRMVMAGQITVPARKLMDICRALPENALIELICDKDKMIVQSGRSRFTLVTLPATDYPCLDDTSSTLEFAMEQKHLRFLLQRTHFSMAQQDVRYYLNGMLLEINEGTIRSVATDGHRLALNAIEASIINNAFSQVIIPRKGVIELLRLLEDSEEEVNVAIMANHIRVASPHFTFTSKLIDGRFPDYERVLPKGGDKTISVPRAALKHSVSRVSILSNEKLRGVQLQLRSGLLRVLANNPEQEEAQEEISIEYNNTDLDIGFNGKYLNDIFDALDDDMVRITFSDSSSSILIEGSKGDSNSLFVVMPMRL